MLADEFDDTADDDDDDIIDEVRCFEEAFAFGSLLLSLFCALASRTHCLMIRTKCSRLRRAIADLALEARSELARTAHAGTKKRSSQFKVALLTWGV